MSVLNFKHLALLVFAGGLAHAAAATRYAKLGGLTTGQALTTATACESHSTKANAPTIARQSHDRTCQTDTHNNPKVVTLSLASS